MNRLLLRSNKSATWTTRVEIIFMNVKYVAVGTSLNGLVVEGLGSLEECSDRVPWRLDLSSEMSVYLLRSGSGDGIVVAGSVAVDESDAGPGDPSRFFMME
ncbi:MAG: hypothetical protein QOD07_3149 [Frankiaceae bacterium]|nr:hypothetical protein [Frankiaceae bacterium]